MKPIKTVFHYKQCFRCQCRQNNSYTNCFCQFLQVFLSWSARWDSFVIGKFRTPSPTLCKRYWQTFTAETRAGTRMYFWGYMYLNLLQMWVEPLSFITTTFHGCRWRHWYGDLPHQLIRGESTINHRVPGHLQYTKQHQNHGIHLSHGPTSQHLNHGHLLSHGPTNQPLNPGQQHQSHGQPLPNHGQPPPNHGRLQNRHLNLGHLPHHSHGTATQSLHTGMGSKQSVHHKE